MAREQAPTGEGMQYLESIPRRLVTLYVPLFVFVFTLLFPFYWMATTSLKPNAELLSRAGNPFWVQSPTLEHFHRLFAQTYFPKWFFHGIASAYTLNAEVITPFS